MKKIILLFSFSLLLNCNTESGNDNESNTVAPGDEIIGTHILDANFVSNRCDQSCASPVKYNGSITFESNKKGSYTIDEKYCNSYEPYQGPTMPFDWSYDGSRWQVETISNLSFEITFYSEYQMISADDCYRFIFD